MAAITQNVEIARSPEDVFSCATGYSHFPQSLGQQWPDWGR